MKKPFIFILLNLFLLPVFGQSSDKSDTLPTCSRASLGLCVGYNFYHNKTIELGLGFQPTEVCILRGKLQPFAGFSTAYELPVVKDKPHAISINAFAMGGLALGLNFNCYFTDKEKTFGLRPMVGLGFKNFGIFWGYNCFLNDNKITGLKHNEWTIRAFIPLVNFKK